MASNPIITFKAGRCTLEGKTVKPDPTPGYLYLYEEDELLHLCWRPRSAPADSPTEDLLMIPTDGSFTPYTGRANASSQDTLSPTNGRIFCLKFSSSAARHFFWMQSKSQHSEAKANWFSARDKRLGDIINQLLSGEDVDVESEVQNLRQSQDDGDDDDDHAMEDVQGPDHGRRGSSTGGAGADATGGDPTVEGQASREGGADGGRAPPNTDAAVQNFLRSLQSSSLNSQSAPQQQQQQLHNQPFTTLSELLTTNTTLSWLTSATPMQIDALCAHLPPSLFLLAQQSSATSSTAEISQETAHAAIEAMATDQKRDLLARVLRSPQLFQSLGSLTIALRDGGLPMVAGALGINVENGGTVKGGTVPLGGGHAVEAFLDGVKRGVEKETEQR